jgi:hypothetical protein
MYASCALGTQQWIHSRELFMDLRLGSVPVIVETHTIIGLCQHQRVHSSTFDRPSTKPVVASQKRLGLTIMGQGSSAPSPPPPVRSAVLITRTMAAVSSALQSFRSSGNNRKRANDNNDLTHIHSLPTLASMIYRNNRKAAASLSVSHRKWASRRANPSVVVVPIRNSYGMNASSCREKTMPIVSN